VVGTVRAAMVSLFCCVGTTPTSNTTAAEECWCRLVVDSIAALAWPLVVLAIVILLRQAGILTALAGKIRALARADTPYGTYDFAGDGANMTSTQTEVVDGVTSDNRPSVATPITAGQSFHEAERDEQVRAAGLLLPRYAGTMLKLLSRQDDTVTRVLRMACQFQNQDFADPQVQFRLSVALDYLMRTLCISRKDDRLAVTDFGRDVFTRRFEAQA